jgi:hypothetical protein
MILAIVAVGEKYRYKVKPHLPKFIQNGWDIRILTDDPHSFPNLKTYKYPNKVFSYIDKLLFPLRLVEELKESVMYIDADCLDFISDELVQNFKPTNEVLYYGNWPEGKYFSDTDLEYFEPLVTHFKKIGFDYNKLPLMIEYLHYFPYVDNVSDVIYDLERLKPIFEYQSIIKKTYYYPGIGNGEGVALAYTLYKNNVSIDLFSSKYFLEGSEGLKTVTKII